MDPNPRSFPVLSYVLSRFHLGSGKKIPFENDIEQGRHRADDEGFSLELTERMPLLKRPDLLAAMAQAISDVATTRSVLRNLGNRPDHESVDAARSKIAEIDDLEFDSENEKEKAKLAYCAIIQLEEMHSAYEELLKDAEERLVKIYKSADDSTADIAPSEGGNFDEEVVRILQEGSLLESVDLSGRGIRFFPEAFGKLRGLLFLNFSDNQLEIIPDSIAGLENLQQLNLSSNSIRSLPDSIGLLINLKVLNLSGNKLKSLPDSISRCRSLVELDVSFNELAYLPTMIGQELHDLQKLSINLNKIRSLPRSICGMQSLRILDARFNEIHGLPHDFGNLKNLEILDLSNNFNDLVSLPESFGDLVNLRELDLSNNQISSLPDSFGKLERLKKLNLEGNPLVIPPSDIVNLGIGAVKEFMMKRWIQILMEEEQKAIMEAASLNSSQAPGGWLTRSTSWLNSVISGASGYLGGSNLATKDPCLNEQL